VRYLSIISRLDQGRYCLERVSAEDPLDISTVIGLVMPDVTESVKLQREQAAVARVASALRQSSTYTEILTAILNELLQVVAGQGAALVQLDRESNAAAVELATAGQAEDHVWLKIRDSGPGIPDDLLPHIFRTFRRQDEAHSSPGFGLGLSITRRIIDGHGGTITVKSTPGVGSSFKISLPRPSSLQLENSAAASTGDQ
jgi:nitrogen-specific signal transduction histidine kinase